METIITICIYVELLTFLVSLVTFKKYSHTPLKYLPLWLGAIVIAEFYSYFFQRVGNVWIHNGLNVFEFYLLSYIFWHYLNKNNKKWLALIVSIYSIVTVVNVSFGIQNFMTEPLSYNYVLSYFSLVIIVAMLFYQKLKTDSYEKGYAQNLLYWICFGILLFYSSVLPLYTVSNWVQSLGDLRFYLTQILIFVVLTKNLIFIIGFVCCKKTYSY